MIGGLINFLGKLIRDGALFERWRGGRVSL